MPISNMSRLNIIKYNNYFNGRFSYFTFYQQPNETLKIKHVLNTFLSLKNNYSQISNQIKDKLKHKKETTNEKNKKGI